MIDLGNYYLRDIEYTEKDMKDIFEYASCKETTKDLGFKRHETIEDTKWAFDNIFFKLPDLGIELPLVIIEKETEKLIGMINYNFIKYYDKEELELGYILNKNYWGNGIMSKACKALIKDGFDKGRKIIRISHEKRNLKSKRVIEKNNFTFEGEVEKTVNNKKKTFLTYYIKK